MVIQTVKNGQEKNFMNDNVFIDTNILIYSIDDANAEKQKTSKSIISKLSENGGIISTQVLQEFYNIATKKLGVSKQDAKLLLKYLSECFVVHKNTVNDILHAVEISIKTQFSFWDSLIIAAAISEDCTILYTEDLNNGQLVEGIILKNPL